MKSLPSHISRQPDHRHTKPLSRLLLSLGIEPTFSKPRLVARIRTTLDEMSITKHGAPVVVLDAPHLLIQPMLEQLNLLFSEQMDGQPLAALVLVGHPELQFTLHLWVHEASAQWLAARNSPGPIDLQEKLGYAKHQVRMTGCTAGTLFTDDGIQNIFETTRGIPHRIAQVCTSALMAGLIDQKSVLHGSTLRKTIADLDHKCRAEVIAAHGLPVPPLNPFLRPRRHHLFKLCTPKQFSLQHLASFD